MKALLPNNVELKHLIDEMVTLVGNNTQLGAMDLLHFVRDKADRMQALAQDLEYELEVEAQERQYDWNFQLNQEIEKETA